MTQHRKPHKRLDNWPVFQIINDEIDGCIPSTKVNDWQHLQKIVLVSVAVCDRVSSHGRVLGSYGYDVSRVDRVAGHDRVAFGVGEDYVSYVPSTVTVTVIPWAAPSYAPS